MINSKKGGGLYPGDHHPEEHHPGEHYPWEHHPGEHFPGEYHPCEGEVRVLLTYSCHQPRLLAFPSHLRRGPTGSLCFPAASAGSQEDNDDIIVNPATKLMVPGPNCMMILPTSGHIGLVPPGCFIHPDTGRVLPEAGHLGYDLLSSALIPITDSNAGKNMAH